MIIYDYFMIIDSVIIKIIICGYEMIIYDYLWLPVIINDYFDY